MVDRHTVRGRPIHPRFRPLRTGFYFWNSVVERSRRREAALWCIHSWPAMAGFMASAHSGGVRNVFCYGSCVARRLDIWNGPCRPVNRVGCHKFLSFRIARPCPGIVSFPGWIGNATCVHARRCAGDNRFFWRRHLLCSRADVSAEKRTADLCGFAFAADHHCIDGSRWAPHNRHQLFRWFIGKI